MCESITHFFSVKKSHWNYFKTLLSDYKHSYHLNIYTGILMNPPPKKLNIEKILFHGLLFWMSVNHKHKNVKLYNVYFYVLMKQWTIQKERKKKVLLINYTVYLHFVMKKNEGKSFTRVSQLISVFPALEIFCKCQKGVLLKVWMY